jgi:hypothetical protein
VINGAWQAEVDLYETRLDQRAKRQERLQGFYKRNLERKEKLANEIRRELNEAKCQLNAIEYGTKKAERNINVARQDLERGQKNISKRMAKQVGKVATLLANVRVIRATGSRREALLAAGNLVRSLIFFVCSLV